MFLSVFFSVFGFVQVIMKTCGLFLIYSCDNKFTCTSTLRDKAWAVSRIIEGLWTIFCTYKFEQAQSCICPMRITSENVAHIFDVSKDEQRQVDVKKKKVIFSVKQILFH